MSDEVTRQAAELRADRDAARAEVAIVIEERDAARAERDNWQQRAEAAQRASAVDASTVQRMTEEVYRLKDAGEQLIAECNRVSAERDAARADLAKERDAAESEIADLRHQRDAALTEVATLIGERNQSRINGINWQQRTEALIRKADALVAERDAALAEAEGLRADMLAHPPELHQELAAERQRHLELIKDYDRREVVITTLEEALKRAENMLKVAQAQHIDERMKGFLAVISQLADQAQDLLP